jgi:hypothetical protein
VTFERKRKLISLFILLDLGTLKVKSGGQLELNKEQDCPELLSDYGQKGPFIRPRCTGTIMTHHPNTNLSLNPKEQTEGMNHTQNTDNLIILPN